MLRFVLNKKIPIVLCLVLSFQLTAAEMLKMEVKRKGKRFYLDSSLLVDAPKNTMFDVLTDYNNLHHFSRGIRQSQEVIPAGDGTRRVYSHLQGCVAFLCRSIEKVELMHTIENQRIVTMLQPELSKKVRWNKTQWDLSEVVIANETNSPEKKILTRIDYRMEFEPGFWVPPLLGTYVIKRSLAEDGLEIVERMEKYAQGQSKINFDKNKTFPLLDLPQVDFVQMKKHQKMTSPKAKVKKTLE